MNHKDVPTAAVHVIQAAPITPHNQALYEAGKSILVDSVNTGREFCSSMIGTSTGAIPVYLGILTFLLPERYILGLGAGATIAMPAIGFLVAAVLFIIGYLPISGELSLDDVEIISRERSRLISHRRTFLWIGVLFFVVSVLGATCVIVVNLGVR